MRQGVPLGRLFGFPVRLDPSALILAVILLLPYLRAGAVSLALVLLLAVGVAILLHEIGHALVVRKMGWSAEIVLHGFGGVTLFRGQPSPRQQVGISVAGPAMNFAVAAVAYGLLKVVVSGLPAAFLDVLLTVNVFLGAFNLLPIVPLDGGQAFRSFLRLTVPAVADRAAAWLSVALSLGLGGYALFDRSLFLAVIAFFLLSQNWSAARGEASA